MCDVRNKERTLEINKKTGKYELKKCIRKLFMKFCHVKTNKQSNKKWKNKQF